VQQAQFTPTLADANYYLLVSARKAATGLAADIGFVNFQNAVHHGPLAFDHGGANAMAQVPSRLVAHSYGALNLASGDAFLGFTEQVSSQEPLVKRQVGIVEDGAGCNGKLVVAILAVEQLLLSLQLDHWAFAAQAMRAFREAETNEQFAALDFGAKQSVYIN
jgi:hypothetical protein